MKPVGRERDIEIAKLKGFRVYEEPKLMAVKDAEKQGTWIIPNWSTNRNDAWELWDELRKEFNHCMHYAIEDDIDIIEIAGMDTVYGKDFADCVSQAWIKWKEPK